MRGKRIAVNSRTDAAALDIAPEEKARSEPRDSDEVDGELTPAVRVFHERLLASAHRPERPHGRGDI